MNIFHHLKLEIVSAIPASNECKIETNTAQGLNLTARGSASDLRKAIPAL